MEARKVSKVKPASSEALDVLCIPRSPNPILTSKELNVLELVSFGYDNRAIADYFHTSGQAVKNMMRVIHLKLGADNRAHAVAVCFRNGWFSERGNGGPKPAGSPERETAFDEVGTQVGKLYALSTSRRRDERGPVASAKFRP